MKWTNQWGKVGIIGLAPKTTELLNNFRAAVEQQIVGTTRFTIFPKDGLEKNGCVSVLLRECYRQFNVRILPREILRRTRALRGALKVTHTKNYKPEDRSRAGASKEGWRLILLQGNAEFMASLEAFEEEHRFPVGSDRIIIRGGKRKPAPPRGQAKQDQHQQHQQRGGPIGGGTGGGGFGGGGSGGGNNGQRSYDRDFPPSASKNSRENLSSAKKGRGRGSLGRGLPDHGEWGFAHRGDGHGP